MQEGLALRELEGGKTRPSQKPKSLFKVCKAFGFRLMADSDYGQTLYADTEALNSIHKILKPIE